MPPSKLTVFPLYNYLQVKKQNKANLHKDFYDSSQLKGIDGFKVQARRRGRECLRRKMKVENVENVKFWMRRRQRMCGESRALVMELSIYSYRFYEGSADIHLR